MQTFGGIVNEFLVGRLTLRSAGCRNAWALHGEAVK